jgi:hypothetical protein
MVPLSEREKVRRITNALEREVEGQLFLNNLEQPVGRIEVDRRGYSSELGSPDVVVWVTIELHIFGALTRLKVPILVEAEEAGYNAAKEDIRKFFERDKLEIPMVVVARNGAPGKQHVERAMAKVDVTMKQVGSERLSDS